MKEAPLEYILRGLIVAHQLTALNYFVFAVGQSTYVKP